MSFFSLLPKAWCKASETVPATPAIEQQGNYQESKNFKDNYIHYICLGLVKSLVAGRTIAAAAVAEGDSCEFGSAKYFALCGLGGILSCGITHTAVVPLDLVKCRIQVDPDKYKSVFNGNLIYHFYFIFCTITMLFRI